VLGFLERDGDAYRNGKVAGDAFHSSATSGATSTASRRCRAGSPTPVGGQTLPVAGPQNAIVAEPV
jgi:hypothetical protein